MESCYPNGSCRTAVTFPSFPLFPFLPFLLLLIARQSLVCMNRIASMMSIQPPKTGVNDVPATLFCMWKNLMTQRSNFTQSVLQRRGNPSAPRSPAAFCLVAYMTVCVRSVCYSANQPVIPLLLMWEVMLHATLSFTHQCSLCLCLYLSLPPRLSPRDCCFPVIEPLFRAAHRAGVFGMFTWIQAPRLLANAAPLFF